MAKDTYYFQHDYEPTADPKIQAMLSLHGALGYALYWRIVEMLHSESSHKLPLKQFIFMALAQQMKACPEVVNSFIIECINVYELFASDNNFIWSERVLRNINKRNEISGKRSIAGKLSAEKRAEIKANPTSAEQVLTSVQQNSTKERKEKKIKENEIKINKSKSVNTSLLLSINISFDTFWDNYDKKTGREKSESLWSKLNENERSLAILQIPKYIQSQPDKQFRKDPATYLLNKSFNDEIINTNGKSIASIQQNKPYSKQSGVSNAGNNYAEAYGEYQE